MSLTWTGESVYRLAAEQTLFNFIYSFESNGWSSRFRRLLQGNNVVFKSTLYVSGPSLN